MFEGLQTAVQQLTAERSRIDSAITSLEKFLSGGTASPTPGRRGRRGRAAKPGAARVQRSKPGKRAPRGLLKAKIHQALKAAKKPLAPVELRDKVARLGYPAKNLKSLYTTVYVTARGDKAIQKTAKGFSLK